MMAISFKRTIKPLLPRPVLEHWKRFRFNAEQAAARNRPLDHVFNEIYAKGMWRPEGTEAVFHSGPGSLAPVTAGYEAFVAGLLERDASIETLVDIGCGDFQVAQRILNRVRRPLTYVGCDIASLVVEHNQRVHGQPGKVSFRTLNVAEDPLPAGDIVTIREVFQHLSNDTILAALANLRRTFKRAIITEALPRIAAAPNLDIVSGYRTRDGLDSGVYLELAPFNLKVLDRYEVPASGSTKDEVLRTLVVEL